jgi:hypothetical protein
LTSDQHFLTTLLSQFFVIINNMHSAIFLSFIAGVATALPTTSIQALDIAKRIVARAPPEANAVLKSATTSGTGCGPNSAQFLYVDGATAAFDSLIVDTTDPASASKKCLITIDIKLDPKWKYTINKQSTVRGYVAGGKGTFKAVYKTGSSTVSSPPCRALPVFI